MSKAVKAGSMFGLITCSLARLTINCFCLMHSLTNSHPRHVKNRLWEMFVRQKNYLAGLPLPLTCPSAFFILVLLSPSLIGFLDMSYNTTFIVHLFYRLTS